MAGRIGQHQSLWFRQHKSDPGEFGTQGSWTQIYDIIKEYLDTDLPEWATGHITLKLQRLRYIIEEEDTRL